MNVKEKLKHDIEVLSNTLVSVDDPKYEEKSKRILDLQQKKRDILTLYEIIDRIQAQVNELEK